MTRPEHFFFVDETKFQPLRPATEDEAKWYHALADELIPYSKNIDRFDRVHEKHENIGQVIINRAQNAMQFERDAKNAVADFLYSFNEFLDHWKVYLSRKYGEDSDYYQHYEKLRKSAFDTFDEYKITYGLRNCQHTEDVLYGISMHMGEPAKLYGNRDKLLADSNLQKDQRKAIEKQPERFDLIPIFCIAKDALEKIQKSLMFFTVTRPCLKNANLCAI